MQQQKQQEQQKQGKYDQFNYEKAPTKNAREYMATLQNAPNAVDAHFMHEMQEQLAKIEDVYKNYEKATEGMHNSPMRRAVQSIPNTTEMVGLECDISEELGKIVEAMESTDPELDAKLGRDVVNTHDVEAVTRMLCRQSPRQQLLDQNFGPELTEPKIDEFLNQELIDDDDIEEARREMDDIKSKDINKR